MNTYQSVAALGWMFHFYWPSGQSLQHIAVKLSICPTLPAVTTLCTIKRTQYTAQTTVQDVCITVLAHWKVAPSTSHSELLAKRCRLCSTSFLDRKHLTCGHLGMDLLSSILIRPSYQTNVFIWCKQGQYGITTAGFLIIIYFLPYLVTDNVNELRQVTLYPAKGNYQDIFLQ